MAGTGLLASLLLAGGTALAVHDTGKFQLDGDAASGTSAIQNPPAATDDWDKVCYAAVQKSVADGGEGLSAADAAARCGIGTSPSTGITATSWTAEPNTSASIFTGGGSKDPIDVTSWAWKDAGGLPDKDNLLHGFAARYSLPSATSCPSGSFATCEVLYFGSDRYDNSGDAQQGVWFFQSKVTTNGSKLGGGTSFTGQHTTGDVLVISDFSNGGTVSTMKIFKWQPICTATNKSSDTGTVPNGDCADANLQSLASSDAANCATVTGAGDAFCGLVNPSTVTMPWSFTDKSGTANNGALNGELYEGGINLSTLNLAGECFSSVLLETRSSTSTTAVLKDFILGQLGTCAPGMTTQASSTGTVAPGTSVTDTATITITGAATPVDPTGDVTFYLCGPLASGASGCPTGGTTVGTGTLNGGTITNDGIATATSPAVNTSGSPLAPGRYCFRAEWPGDSNYGGTSHTNNDTECFSVQDTSSMTTAQRWLPNDSATVTSGAGTALSGTVSWTLYEGTINCATPGTATVLYGPVTQTLTNATSPATVSTNNQNTFIVTSGTNRTVTWRVTFTSSSAGVGSPSAPTCETTTITIAN
jgi:hypothetical protein